MVKIPALELDGQNWKIYRAKLLEHAATKGWLDVLAGASDDGTSDWEGYNALLHELLHDTIPISIYIRLRRNTAHQVFKYLTKRFRDREPIGDPRAKKLATCANEAKRHPSAEAPTSENAATERHAHAEREDLPCTKDLIRGTKDVNDGNIRREDPRTSLEASAEGTSAERAEGPMAPCVAMPHETPNRPQNSLQATPQRLPIEDEPCECEQEVAESVVTAERTKGTAQSANPPETDADVDGKAALGREPAERVHAVDEGTETERDSQSRLQQTNFYCKESRQHDENANANVPYAYGLPLAGEWAVYASGKDRNSDADGPSESKETEGTAGVESEGCEGVASERTSIDELEAVVECCQQLCMADGNPGRGIQPADIPNESDPLVTRSVEPYVEDGKTSVHVHLRGASWRADDTNGAGHGVDGLTGETDVSRGSMDMLGASNRAETAGISYGEGAGTYLGVRDAKRVVNATDGVRSRTDASSGHTVVPSVETDARTTANDSRTVRTRQNESKTPNSPMETTRRRPDEPNGCGSHADASSASTHAHCVGNKTETAGNEAEHVRTHRNGSRTQNSPNAIDIATAKLPRRWRKVSIGGGDVYVPFNAPIAIPMRRIVFGRPESGDEAIAPSLEGERAGDGDGNGNRGDGDDGDANGTTSGGDADSMRVEAALLAAKSQYMRYRPRSR